MKAFKRELTSEKHVFDFIKHYLLDEFEIPESKISPDAGLFSDLELDSIDTFNMASMLEMEIEIEINDDELKRIVKVQDIVNCIRTKLSPEAASCSGTGLKL